MKPSEVADELDKLPQSFESSKMSLNKLHSYYKQRSTSSKIAFWVVSFVTFGFAAFYQRQKFLRAEKQTEAIKKEKERTLHKEKVEMSDKFKSVSDSQNNARKVCRKWTNTPCSSYGDYLSFAQKYAYFIAIDRKFVKGVQNSAIDNHDIAIIRTFRKEFASYFTKIDYTNAPPYPASGEYYGFLTFHWVCVMTNNISAQEGDLHSPYNHEPPGEPYSYKLAFAELQRRDPELAEKANQFQIQFRPNFFQIRRELLPKAKWF